MRFVFKILAFIALLLISKFTRQDTLTTPAESPQVIVSAQNSNAQKPPAALTGGRMHEEATLPGKTVQTLVATPATIK